jgi:hypothetical protein
MNQTQKNTLMYKVIPLLLLSCLMIHGCKKEQLAPLQFAHWVENPSNGLKVVQTAKDFRLEALFKPLDYIVAMEARKTDLEKDFVEARKLELGDQLDYFNFRISPALEGSDVWNSIPKASDPQVKDDIIHHLSYGMKEDFYLLDGLDTLDCKMYQFANTVGITPYLEFVMAFEKRPDSDRVLVYDDKVLGIDPIRFHIKKEKINHTPTLKTQ